MLAVRGAERVVVHVDIAELGELLRMRLLLFLTGVEAPTPG
ncbi:MAG: hypothetical protein QM702_02100 [Rubrivivax sp.]